MPDTGAPYEIPFLDGTELVRDYPDFSEDLADAIVEGLDGIPVLAGIGSNVVQTVMTSTFTASLAPDAESSDITDLAVTITPSSNTAKILIVAYISFGSDVNRPIGARLLRGSTAIAQGSGGTNVTVGANPSQRAPVSAVVSFLDSPGSASAVTYNFRIVGLADVTQAYYINRANVDIGRTVSTATAIEVAP